MSRYRVKVTLRDGSTRSWTALAPSSAAALRGAARAVGEVPRSATAERMP